MMVPKKSLLLAGAALVCMGVTPYAQKTGAKRKGPVIKRVTEPLRSASLNLETGVLTRGPKVDNRAFGTVSTLNNTDFIGFVGVDTGLGGAGPSPCEWWDKGDKNAARAGGATGLMASFAFAYCSGALSTLSGGPGGRAVISFREGYSVGTLANAGGPTGTLLGAFTLTGLPANTGSQSFFGNTPCTFLPIGFGAFPLAYGGDGSGGEPSVAWGWKFADLGSDGVLAQTFPFMGCVASCTNTPGSQSAFVRSTLPGNGLDGVGMSEEVDQYCPQGTILSTFTFGTTVFGSYFTSINMDIREQALQTFQDVLVPSTPNKNGVGPASVIGGASIDITETGSPAMGVGGVKYTYDCSLASNPA
jgi:hypothetical protein